MVVPYAHQATLSQLDSDTLTEMIVLAQRLEGALQTIYRPEGFNVRRTLAVRPARESRAICTCTFSQVGRGHQFHDHCLRNPRASEELAQTYERLRRALEAPARPAPPPSRANDAPLPNTGGDASTGEDRR